jgi:hypothetical protein
LSILDGKLSKGIEMPQNYLIAIIVVLLGVLLRVKEPMAVGRMLPVRA